MDRILKYLKFNNVHLLDIPNHRNVGDYLILEGELIFFKNNNINLKSISSLDSLVSSNIKDKDVIIFHGGGNFGDLYFKHTNFRNEIIKNFKKNLIIILPQTFHFESEDKLLECIKIFNEHKNIIIYARDKESFNKFKKYFKYNKILLGEDSAFFLNFKKRYETNKKKLYLSRKDKEFKSFFDLNEYKYVNSDWFNLNIYNFHTILYIPLLKFKRYIRPKFYNLLLLKYSKILINYNLKKISNFDLIITDRLHGIILASLLGIKVIGIDNSYSKNKNYYETWLKHKKNIYFVNNEDEFKKLVKKLLK